MSRFMIFEIRRYLALALAFCFLGLAAGCSAPAVSARVTSFQQWPAGVEGQTYRFVTVDAAQINNLEYQNFQDMVRAGIGATGLVETQGPGPARFNVSFHYGTTQTQQMVRRPFEPQPFFHGGFYGSRGGWGGGAWGGGPWGWGGPAWVDMPTVAFRNSLTLVIQDNERNGVEVYRASAHILTPQENLLGTMPFLVQAIFDHFPGNNGTERQVSMPVLR